MRASGRPRDPAVTERIGDACKQILAEVGYSGLTIDSVADRAGVSRPTIYRRWPSKASMVWDVVFARADEAPVIGDTDDLRADVDLWVAAAVEFFSRPEVADAFPGLIIEPPLDAGQGHQLRDPAKELVVARFQRAVVEGQVRSDFDVAAIFDVVTGFAIYRASVPSPDQDQASIASVVDLVLRGALVREP